MGMQITTTLEAREVAVGVNSNNQSNRNTKIDRNNLETKNFTVSVDSKVAKDKILTAIKELKSRRRSKKVKKGVPERLPTVTPKETSTRFTLLVTSTITKSKPNNSLDKEQIIRRAPLDKIHSAHSFSICRRCTSNSAWLLKNETSFIGSIGAKIRAIKNSRTRILTRPANFSFGCAFS